MDDENIIELQEALFGVALNAALVGVPLDVMERHFFPDGETGCLRGRGATRACYARPSRTSRLRRSSVARAARGGRGMGTDRDRRRARGGGAFEQSRSNSARLGRKRAMKIHKGKKVYRGSAPTRVLIRRLKSTNLALIPVEPTAITPAQVGERATHWMPGRRAGAHGLVP